MKKTILITGSTDGIGRLTAFYLAKEGFEVILHGRNAEKLDQSKAEIIESTGNQQVHQFQADFSDLASLRIALTSLNDKVSKIDVLINNAGVFQANNEKTKDDLDVRFVVNYLAPVLLTNQLMPLLNKGENQRIINLSSAAQAPVSLSALSGTETLSTQSAYAQSKLALTMWSFYLASQEKQVNVIAVNPGSLLNTKMVQEAYGQFWAPAEKGAKVLYELATSDEYQSVSGKYFDNDKGSFGDAHKDAYAVDKVEKLIVATMDLLSNYEYA